MGTAFEYKFVDSWGTLPLWWHWWKPSDVAIDSKDRVFVLDRGTQPVKVFDKDGRFITAWTEPLQFRTPHGLYIDKQDSVYITDCYTHLVQKFSLDGKLVKTWGTRDVPSPTSYGLPFNQPTGVAFGPSGCMYVSDGYGNFKVQKFSPDGSFLKSWGSQGKGQGEFTLVHQLDVDSDEHVYVCDREGRRVQVFDEDGKYIREWNGLSLPVDIKVQGDLVYVLEEGNEWDPIYEKYGPSGVAIFSRDGGVVARWKNGERGTKGMYNLHGLTVDSRGDFYATQIYDSSSTIPFSDAVFKFVLQK